MRCSDVQYFTPLYLSGELDSRSMAEFDGHLSMVRNLPDINRGDA